MLERIKPTLNMNTDIFTNGKVYNHIDILRTIPYHRDTRRREVS